MKLLFTAVCLLSIFGENGLPYLLLVYALCMIIYECNSYFSLISSTIKSSVSNLSTFYRLFCCLFFLRSYSLVSRNKILISCISYFSINTYVTKSLLDYYCTCCLLNKNDTLFMPIHVETCIRQYY